MYYPDINTVYTLKLTRFKRGQSGGGVALWVIFTGVQMFAPEDSTKGVLTYVVYFFIRRFTLVYYVSVFYRIYEITLII